MHKNERHDFFIWQTSPFLRSATQNPAQYATPQAHPPQNCANNTQPQNALEMAL